jgi:hypothetical protein
MPLGGVALFVSVNGKSRFSRKQKLSVNVNLSWDYFLFSSGRAMPANGSAIKGGCISAIGGVAHFLPYRYQVLWPLRVLRYRAFKILVNYPGAVKFIGGSGAVRVYPQLQSCLGCRSKLQNL